ncbi:MAG: protein kinase [Acidobacteria bacterium]|nr:protein kinase [Acidobacteriota bacterium]
MTPERWRRIEELFHQASEMAAESRAAWLDGACEGDKDLERQVLELLASDDEAGGGFVEGHVGAALKEFDAAPAPAPERRAGPYRLVREIGRGGMGTVFLGERADEQYHAQVAVKLLRTGFDTDFFLARFRRERQTLAQLQHPNIARLLDSGTSDDGMPYIVMEYIEGQSITDYCARERLNIEQRLSLFLPVCAAVAHAHQRFVVHRDIKPSNILVDTAGTPKLLDFGICKILATEAAPDLTMTTGATMLTPDYASPEQILGDPITVASDTYSLGAVLYELLSGCRPHRIEKMTPQAIERAICGEDPPRPSAVALRREDSRRLAGDLDTIVLKAMQKDAARRYASVEEFVADIRNFLEHRPILARPDTIGYRAAKFARRNRGAVAAAVALTFTLSAGLLATTREARRNERNFAIARSLASSFVFEVHDSIGVVSPTKVRENIVRIGLKYLDTLSAGASGDAGLQLELAEAYRRIGEVQGNVMAANLGNTAGAMASYRKALALVEPLPASRASLLSEARLYRKIADIEIYTKRPMDALAVLERGVAAGDRLLRIDPQSAESRSAVAGLHLTAGRVKRMMEDRQGTIDTARRAQQVLMAGGGTPTDPEVRALVAESFAAMGTGQMMLGQPKEALDNFRKAATAWDGLCGQAPANVEFQRQRMLAYSHVGDVLGNPSYSGLNDRAGARDAYRVMMDTALSLHRADPHDHRSAVDYGIATMRVADTEDEAGRKAKLFSEASRALTEVVRGDPRNRLARLNLASVERRLGDVIVGSDPAGARAAYQRGVRVVEAMEWSEPAAERVGVELYRSAALLALRQGLGEEARDYSDRALRVAERIVASPSSPLLRFVSVPKAYQLRGEAMEKLGDAASARQWYERAVVAWGRASAMPGFTDRYRDEKKMAERALERLGGRAAR